MKTWKWLTALAWVAVALGIFAGLAAVAVKVSLSSGIFGLMFILLIIGVMWFISRNEI